MAGGKKKRKLIRNTTTDVDVDVDVDDKKPPPPPPPPWSDLPYELLEMIKKRLFFIDQVYFRAVCKSWSCIEKVQPLQQTPWLFVEDENDDNVNKSCKLVDSRGGNNNKPYTINGKALKDKFNIKKFKPRLCLHESKFGWLLLSNCYKFPTKLVFYSPFLDESICFIDLPSLGSINITYATFTSNPLDDEDCTVLALQKNDDGDNTMIRIYTYRLRGGHDSWTSKVYKCEFLVEKVKCWMYAEGMLYYVTKNGTVGKFDLAREAWNVFPSLPAPMPIDPEQNLQYHLVKSDGELFLILQCNLSRHMHDWWSYYSHYIYRLDMSSMIWDNLKSIGDRALFVGTGYNKFLNASVLKLNGERKRMSDMIYYTSYYTLNYCSAHEFTLRNPAVDGRSRRHDCSRHYGPIVKKKRCIMLLIDPPPR